MRSKNACNVIANFMGLDLISIDARHGLMYFTYKDKNKNRGVFHMRSYVSSLDSLKPVWSRMAKHIGGIEIDLCSDFNDFRVTICSDDIGHPYIKYRSSDLEEAATVATADAIELLELTPHQEDQ